MTFPPLALNRARLAHFFEFALESRNSLLDPPSIHFQLGFTRAAGSDSAGLPRQVMPHPGQARQQVLQLCQLNLQPSFTTPRPLRKNVQNELGAIEHLARKQVFEISSLRRR